MSDMSNDLLNALGAGPEVLAALVRGTSEDEARRAIGGDEGWSVIEVFCHLRDAEERGVQRARAMRDEDAPFIEAYDQDAWARERNYAADSLAAAMTTFLQHRAEHLALLEALDDDGWLRTGRHEEQGLITIQSQALHLAAHDTIHAAQIARQLADLPDRTNDAAL